LTVASHDPALATLSRADVPAATADRRPPPKANCILLPVWGEDFISKFFEISLPTLLAPGNVPALAAALPTRFVFLTRTRDERSFRDHAAFRRLDKLCAVDFLPIDDLIMAGNHSTTVTLAYARAVRQAGEAMLDTCFFFLVSDYIMANGSLASVFARMRGGASAVQVGNFQLEDGPAESWLDDRPEDARGVLEPREVMRWALRCLHPITAANIINYPLCHNSAANRLLWRVDSDTMIGRFYLLHMICIRPEVTDFVVGSSCDYSFVPEMCPSGNVVTLTDSDEYLVVEIQPRNHEDHFLRIGQTTAEALAKHLSEWTTARHRANAEQTLIFHAKALPTHLPTALDEASQFVDSITARLSPAPQPHREHPYWIGAIAALNLARARAQTADVPTRDSDRIDAGLPLLVKAIGRVQFKLFGRVPEVTRAHPHWQDFAAPVAACKAMVEDTTLRLLVGASRSTPLIEGLRYRRPDSVFFSPRTLLRGRKMRLVESGAFDAAFVELVDNDIADMPEILQRLTPFMRPGGQITVVAVNRNWFGEAENFGRFMTNSLGTLAGLRLWPETFHAVSATRRRWNINNASITLGRTIYQRPTRLLLPHIFAMAIVLLPLMAGANLLAAWRADPFSLRGVTTSVFLRLRVDDFGGEA
jgi:hypothetical protein